MWLVAGMVLPSIFLVLALAAFGWGIRLRQGPYRSAAPRAAVPRFRPPTDAGVSLAADVARVPTRAFCAELVDLAVGGYLAIVVPQRPRDGERPRQAYGVRLLTVDRSSLSPQQASLMQALFGDEPVVGDVVALYQYDLALSTRLDAHRDRCADQATELGYRDDRYRWLRADRTPWWGYLIVAVLVVAPLVHVFAAAASGNAGWAMAAVDALAMLVAPAALTAFNQTVSLSSLSGLYATGSLRGNLGGAAGGGGIH
jgi:hypothetical protein